MRKKGFTLIELLIVIVIIGIIASLAIPLYKKTIIHAQGVEAKQALQAVAGSLERYLTETGKFPPVGAEGLPAGIDMKPPASTYFWYHYGTIIPEGVTIVANRTDIIAYPADLAKFPVGTVIVYEVTYNKQSADGQSVGTGWYKHYSRQVIKSLPPMAEVIVEAGW